MSDPSTASDVHFGIVGGQLANWRRSEDPDAIDTDDELLDETPQDVVSILGFDPMEFNKTS